MKCIVFFVLATSVVVSSKNVETGVVIVRDLNPNDVAEPVFLRLQIEGSGKEHRLSLRRRDNINTNFPVFTVGTNGRTKEEDVRSEGLTAYHDLDKKAAVLVKSERIANGVYRRSVSGHIDDGTHSIYLEPSKRHFMNTRRNVGSGVPHLMTRRRKEIRDIDSGAIPLDSSSGVKEEGKRKRTNDSPVVSKRVSDGPYYVEILALCDYACYQSHVDRGEKLQSIKEYYTMGINGADLNFEEIVDPDISLSLVGLYVYTEPDIFTYNDQEENKIYGVKALKNVREWRQSPKLPKHDHVMLFTGYNLYHTTDKTSTGAVGQAWLGGVCGYDRESIIQNDLFFLTLITTISHELGHNLNADHDGYTTSKDCPGRDNFIMDGSRPESIRYQNQYLFSPCSIKSFRKFIDGLDRDGENCLKNVPNPGTNIPKVPYVGQVYHIDQQCAQYFGVGYRFYRGTVAESLMCMDVSCVNDFDHYQDDGFGALPGTTCGNKKWCINGNCVSDYRAPSAPERCIYGDTLWADLKCEESAASDPDFCSIETNRAYCCGTCKNYYD